VDTSRPSLRTNWTRLACLEQELEKKTEALELRRVAQAQQTAAQHARAARGPPAARPPAPSVVGPPAADDGGGADAPRTEPATPPAPAGLARGNPRTPPLADQGKSPAPGRRAAQARRVMRSPPGAGKQPGDRGYWQMRAALAGVPVGAAAAASASPGAAGARAGVAGLSALALARAGAAEDAEGEEGLSDDSEWAARDARRAAQNVAARRAAGGAGDAGGRLQAGVAVDLPLGEGGGAGADGGAFGIDISSASEASSAPPRDGGGGV
jgi:hypothetical protein